MFFVWPDPVHLRSAAALVVAAAATACAGRAVPTTLEPSLAAEAVRATAPQTPLRVVFAWQAQDGSARFHGRGVARIAPEYRARLDLFGPGGDGYLTAALVEHELRLPGGGEGQVRLPPPALMWAVLGVVAPPDGAVLLGTSHDDEGTALFYELPDGRLVYSLVRGRLARASWERRGGTARVELKDYRGTVPGSALYRDRAANMELLLNVEQTDTVESFPPGIWEPDR